MSYYWIHVGGGTSFAAFGPFENVEVFRRFRATYADDENEDGYRRSVDELPELPGLDDWDDHEDDAWIPVHADNLVLDEGWPTISVQEQATAQFDVRSINTMPSY